MKHEKRLTFKLQWVSSNRRIFLGILAILTAISIAACSGVLKQTLTHSGHPATLTDTQAVALNSSSVSAQNCRTLRHEMGETQICGRPQKIIVLGPYLLELLLALDIQPAGFADHISLHQGKYNYPSQQIPFLGNRVTSQPENIGLASEPSIEAILKLKPDLIVGSDWLAQQYQTLSKIAPTLLLKLFDAETNLRVIAQAVGRPEKAEQLIAERQQLIAQARKDFAPVVKDYPNLLMLAASNIHDFILLTKSNSACGSLVDNLGFKLVYPPGMSEKIFRPQVSLEILPSLDKADSILLLESNLNQLKAINEVGQSQKTPLAQAWEKNAIAQYLKASKAKRVYSVPAYLCIALPGAIGTELSLKELRKQMLGEEGKEQKTESVFEGRKGEKG